MNDSDVKYYYAENRHIWRLMGWSLAWLTAGAVGVCLAATWARAQGPRWIDWAMILLSACAFGRALVLSFEVKKRDRALTAFVEEVIKRS